jgi:hypothetical protein
VAAAVQVDDCRTVRLWLLNCSWRYCNSSNICDCPVLV